MPSVAAYARENGWAQLISRGAHTILRRFRDSFTARKLSAPNFRCGRSPRLLGLSHMKIGRNFSAGDSLWLHAISSYEGHRHTPNFVIGDAATFSDNVHIACIHSVIIGENALFGSRVIVSDHGHGIYRGASQSPPEMPPVLRPLGSAGPIVIGRNVWLGDGVAVLAGAAIGDGCIIGTNSVVTGNIPAGTIAVGSPAKPIRRWNAASSEWLAMDI